MSSRPLHAFKHKSSIIYMQQDCHRSILFKEIMRFSVSDNATVLSVVVHEERDTSLKTFKIPLYSTHIYSHYLAILKGKTVCCFHILQNIPSPHTTEGSLQKNNTVGHLFSCCKAECKCTEPDFPKASLSFPGQTSAHLLCFRCSSQ